MSQHDSSVISATPIMPVVSELFASYSNAEGFWIKERGVPTTKNEGGAVSHPLSSSLLNVDIARELRSAQYSRNKAKNEANFARAQKSKGQGRPRRGNPTQRSKGTKRSGKRQPISRDLAAGSESDYEQDLSDPAFPGRRDAVPTPVRTSERCSVSATILSEPRAPTEKTPKVYTPPDAYTTAVLPESTLDVPAPDVARESRSYERHRNQIKKKAEFKQSKEKKGTKVKPVRSRGSGSGSVKTKNLQSLVALAVVYEETTSEDEIQTPVEVSLSVILPEVEHPEIQPPAVDMEALITTAKIRYTKGSSKSLSSTPPCCANYDVEPGFEYVKSVRSVVALDEVHDTSRDDDDEPWEHVWNDDLVD